MYIPPVFSSILQRCLELGKLERWGYHKLKKVVIACCF